MKNKQILRTSIDNYPQAKKTPSGTPPYTLSLSLYMKTLFPGGKERPNPFSLARKKYRLKKFTISDLAQKGTAHPGSVPCGGTGRGGRREGAAGPA